MIDEEIKKMNDEFKDLTKDMGDVLRNKAINDLKSKYTTCIEKVVRDRRDKELSEKLFGADGVKAGDIIKIVDKYEDIERSFIEFFDKSVVVRSKDNDEEEES